VTLFRVVKMSSGYYAKKIFSLSEEVSEIEEFLTQGETVILGDDLDSIADDLDLEEGEIKLVED